MMMVVMVTVMALMRVSGIVVMEHLFLKVIFAMVQLNLEMQVGQLIVLMEQMKL